MASSAQLQEPLSSSSTPTATSNVLTFCSHPGLLHVVHGSGDFSSKLTVLKPFRLGETVCKIEGFSVVQAPRYTTVQVAVSTHIELNSDLVFMNHSCSPSVKLDTTQMKVIALKDLNAGDEITFFYPSTEYTMAQPFPCWCGAKECVRIVAGAMYVPVSQLSNYFVNKHIKEAIVKSLSAHDAPLPTSSE